MQDTKKAFSTYFQEWLYAKDGYYSGYKEIGKEGDFYTAVSSSSFFGGAIGKRVIDSINEGILSENATIIEIGAHHGYLLADMIQFIFTLNPKLIKTLKFAIVERYEHLQIQQQAYFKDSFGKEIQLFHYSNIDEIEEKEAFIVANELFDAFPCDLVYTNTEGTLQKAIIENDTIKFVQNDDNFLQEHCTKYKVNKGEVGRGYEEFALSLCKNIKKFEFITFDYGEKYPRNDFSCRIYKNHTIFALFDTQIELKKLYKKSDITYDLNFSHLIESFAKAGAVNIGYKTQLQALVDFGIIELLEILHKNVDKDTYLQEVNRVKTLLNPTGMGDRFKMVHFRKGKK